MAADRLATLAASIAAAAFGSALAATVTPAEPPTIAGKPSRVAAKSVPTHVWHDGGVERALVRVPSLEADFSPVQAGAAGPIRPAGSAAAGAAAFVSPVLRDDAGRLRALPGGVLVVLRAPLDETAARALLARAGVEPAARLSATLWRVQGPVGLGSLELANRLHASGLFASAQPDWWVERTRK
jgi:hypothetical protein